MTDRFGSSVSSLRTCLVGVPGIYLLTGILLICFGLVVLFSPVAAGDLVVKVTSVVLLITGIVRLAHAFKSQGRMETILSTLLGAVIAGLGVLVWLNPDLGSGFLTILLVLAMKRARRSTSVDTISL